MCGRYTMRGRRSDEIQQRMAERLGVELPESREGYGRFNVAPTQELLAVVEDDRGRRVEELRWGLVPHWAKQPRTRFAMINARAETLHAKPAYRALVDRSDRRCLVLADGWYEWQRPEDRRQPRRPLHFSLAEDGPFCFAGLWTKWRSPEAETLRSFTIVTCAANELVHPIHERMPVVFDSPEQWEEWLDGALDTEGMRELLAPLPSSSLRVAPANPLVNSADNEGPACLQAAAVA